MQETIGVADVQIELSIYTSPDPPVGPGCDGVVLVFGGRGGLPQDELAAAARRSILLRTTLLHPLR